MDSPRDQSHAGGGRRRQGEHKDCSGLSQNGYGQIMMMMMFLLVTTTKTKA